MLNFPKTMRIFVAATACDMRRQFNGLATLVRESLGCDPRSGDLFVFQNRRRDILKIIFFDTQGYCILAKRLERGQFEFLDCGGKSSVEIDSRQLASLLSNVRISLQTNDIAA